MKVLGRVILFLIVVVPIIVCVVTLNNVWKDDSNYDQTNVKPGNDNIFSGDLLDLIESGDIKSGEVSGEMAGEQYVSKIGSPISKIYTDATVAITVANVYDEANENSEIVGTIEKYAVITAHQYPEGWTRVSNGTISGWMRTENISFPEGGLISNPEVKTGKVTAEPYLNMRASTNTSAAIITTIPKGTTVTIKDTKDGWYKVTYASATGWVSSDYVKLDS